MPAERSNLAIVRRLLALAHGYRRHLFALLALSVVAPCLKLLTPVPLQIAVDNVLGGQPLPDYLAALGANDVALLAVAAAALVALALAGHLLSLGASLLGTYVGEQLVRGFRAVLFRHAQRLSLAYHDSKGTTDSIYRIQYDASSIQWILVEGSIPLATSALSLAVMVVVVACLDWQLALVALAVVPALFVLTRLYGRRLHGEAKEARKLESSALSVVHEVLGAVRVVKAFGQEDRERERFAAWSGKGARAQLRIALMTGFLSLLVGVTLAAGTAATLYLGVRHVQAGVLTLGELLIVMAYLAQLYGPLETVSKKLADLQGSLVCADRAVTLLDAAPDVVEHPNARPLRRAAGAVSFEGVCFAYAGGPAVLKDIALEVPAGARVGIEGKTGAGKTTLVSLLTRFYDPTAGAIRLDGVDLREYRLADLRNQFSFVLQEAVLFSTSIAENIAYARPGATEEEIVAAARAANAHDFIAALPDGYDTSVGERGMRLSGGERQRIALARAFLRDAPILILDEPTSAVDTRTETQIMEALNRLMAGRTTFIIAHRLSTLRDCTLRLRLEHGRLAAPEAALATAGGADRG
jgi:ATP-binding cassette subfamily B protein